jgi:hypothetical protein
MLSQIQDVLTTRICTAGYNRKESFLPSCPVYDFLINPFSFYLY